MRGREAELGPHLVAAFRGKPARLALPAVLEVAEELVVGLAVPVDPDEPPVGGLGIDAADPVYLPVPPPLARSHSGRLYSGIPGFSNDF